MKNKHEREWIMNTDNKKNLGKIFLIINTSILFFWMLFNYERVLGWIGTLIGILLPIILGVSLAFILNMPMKVNERLLGKFKGKFINKVKRPVSLVLAIVEVIFGVFLVLFIVLPEVAQAFSTIAESIPGFIVKAQEVVNTLLTQIPEGEVQKFLADNWKNVGEQIWIFFDASATLVMGAAIGVVSNIFSGILTFFVGFVVAIYVLSQKEVLASQFKKLMYSTFKEERADRMVYVLSLTSKAFNNFFTGQCLEAVIIGALFFVLMSLFKFPYALVSAIIIGVTALIPIFGAFIGCIISAFFIVVTAADKVIPFLVLFLIIQQVEGNLIYPKVVGGSVGLPGLWVLIAVSVGGSLMGVIGMIIMVPVSSVIYILLKEFAQKGVMEKNIPVEKYAVKKS